MVSYVSNAEIARILEEIGRLRAQRGDTPYRVSAYRNAALQVRRHETSLAGLFERDGLAGLRELPGIGDSLARTIGEICRRGRSRQLDRLQREHEQLDPLTTLPSIGPRLAARIRGQLGISSLEELARAAADGRLRKVPGLGRKRVQAVLDNLQRRLRTTVAEHRSAPPAGGPTVGELLELDRRYRAQATAGRLPLAAPKRFNPTAARWLPVLRCQQEGARYVVHFANTARSHEWSRARDWVVIRREDKPAFGWWTVVTARSGPLRGRRVVRGRERECLEFYTRDRLVQLELPRG